MYADDTSITYAGKDLNEIDDYLNKDLKFVNTWLSSNKLTLNLSKTEFLVKTSRQRRVYLSDNPSLLPLVHDFPIEPQAPQAQNTWCISPGSLSVLITSTKTNH